MVKFTWKTVAAATAVAVVLGASVFAYAQLSPNDDDGPIMGRHGRGMMGGMHQMHAQMMQSGGMHGGMGQGMHGNMEQGMKGGMHGGMGMHGGSPYAGEQNREIKALSPQEIDGLKNARGMGLARAAELNGYPGPMHVLELADTLNLSGDQFTKLRDIKARMSAAATPIGLELIEKERALDQLFAKREIDKATLEKATAEIGALKGRLRAVHLAAHLETSALLDDAQRKKYDTLRGYASINAAPGPR